MVGEAKSQSRLKDYKVLRIIVEIVSGGWDKSLLFDNYRKSILFHGGECHILYVAKLTSALVKLTSIPAE